MAKRRKVIPHCEYCKQTIPKGRGIPLNSVRKRWCSYTHYQAWAEEKYGKGPTPLQKAGY